MAKFVTDKYANAKTIFELSVFSLTDLRNGTVMLKLLLELSPFISRKHNNQYYLYQVCMNKILAMSQCGKFNVMRSFLSMLIFLLYITVYKKFWKKIANLKFLSINSKSVDASEL